MIAKKSIQVLFMDDSQAITAHTCSGLLVFPHHEFRGYEDFSVALKAVLSTNSLILYKQFTLIWLKHCVIMNSNNK